MANILDGMIFAAIMASLEMFQDECKQHDVCSDCNFKDENGICLFNHCPERYDIDKIRKALTK